MGAAKSKITSKATETQPVRREPAKDQVVGGTGLSSALRYSSTRTLESDYTIESKVLGSGINGAVRLATGKSDGRKYAVKSFKKTGLSAKKRAELKNEAEIYLSLDHPHVARLEMVYETDDDVHFVMENMAGGELYDRLASRKQYTEEAAAEATHQMLLAVAYLHAHGIAHRDLKLENFLYESKDTDHLKIIDFGFASITSPHTKMSQACGSIHYVAPEVLAHSYTEKADMWSLGVIAYMLLTGSPPFHGSDSDVLKNIRKGNVHWSSRFKKLSEPARNFVQRLLVLNPDQRLSAQEALEHPWIQGRQKRKATLIDADTLSSLRIFAHTSQFRRSVLNMMVWSLSTEDQLDLRKQFLSVDLDNTGTITLKDFKRVFVQKLGVDDTEAEALFQSLDTDNDHEIEYSEFLAASIMGRLQIYEHVLRKTFQRVDRNGDGTIDFEELRSVLGDSFSETEVEELLQEADVSGDGVLDYEEFLAYFHRPESDSSEDDAHVVDKTRSKRRHTEKLGRVVDMLLTLDDEAPPRANRVRSQ